MPRTTTPLEIVRNVLYVSLFHTLSCPSMGLSRQNEAFRRWCKSPLPCLQGFQGLRTGETLDKMINGRKSGKTRRQQGPGRREKVAWQGDGDSRSEERRG